MSPRGVLEATEDDIQLWLDSLALVAKTRYSYISEAARCRPQDRRPRLPSRGSPHHLPDGSGTDTPVVAAGVLSLPCVPNGPTYVYGWAKIRLPDGKRVRLTLSVPSKAPRGGGHLRVSAIATVAT
jgi:hypothetical protein